MAFLAMSDFYTYYNNVRKSNYKYALYLDKVLTPFLLSVI